MSDSKRDECIALEAAMIATKASALQESFTYGEIAEKAIAKVDEACAKGELDLLHYSWTEDRDS